MKEVMAIIRMNKINQTKKALAEAGIPSVHARECLGRGKGLVDLDILKGAEAGYEEAISLLGNSQQIDPQKDGFDRLARQAGPQGRLQHHRNEQDRQGG